MSTRSAAVAQLLHSTKRKWAAGISGVLWFLVFAYLWSLVGYSSSNVNFLVGFRPLILLGAFVGFLLTAILLWAVFAGVDAIRRVVSRSKP